jgi:hypothetical protein
MATTYPGTIDSFTNPSGTSTLDSPDHAQQHSDANDAIEAIEAVIGTTAGTSVLKDFSAGEFPARVNSGGTLTQTLTGGTINATTLGTPTVTGGSFASPTTTGTDAGTATLTNKTLTSPKINENVALTSTATELNALHGKTGAWSDYTPGTSGITVGNGTISARYLQIGKLVFAMVKFTLGSTSAIGTDPRIKEPVAAHGPPETLGNARFVDNDTSIHYQGWWRSGYIGYNATTYGGIKSTVPFTWATNDIIWLSIMYEAQ